MIELFFGIISLFIGGMIYLAFRDDSLLMFRWCNEVGLTDAINSMRETTLSMPIPDFFRYCLPDGLWTISFILVVDALVEEHQIMWALSLPSVALFLEVLQSLHIIRGVFDWGDVLCYVIPIIVYVISKLIHNEKVS